jgi:hypothetical protein
MSEQLIELANSLRTLVKQSDKFTKMAVDSIDLLDADVAAHKQVNQTFFQLD